LRRWRGAAGEREYRVLRRLAPRPPIAIPDGVVTRTGLFVDVETTGLDWRRDEIIELAMIPFRYGMRRSDL
jgi:DNA polymerase-3 subunit epsilon